MVQVQRVLSTSFVQLPHLRSDGRKFRMHLGAKLQNLRREFVEPCGQLFERRHAFLEPFYSRGKHLRWHGLSVLWAVRSCARKTPMTIDASSMPGWKRRRYHRPTSDTRGE